MEEDKKKILIIEDNKDLVKMLFARLEREGYKVYATLDAVGGMSEAIKVAPDLMLLDIMMPAGGGITVLKNIKDNTKTFNIPIIIITALSDERTKNKAEELGVSGYFVKPLDTPKLIARIKEILQA